MFFFRRNPLIIRKIHTVKPEIFLTFDDGPTKELTPRILDLLQEAQVTATFFVIGRKAQENPKILKRMLAEGHTVLSHSLDHRYDLYFRGKERLKTWLRESLQSLDLQTGLRQRAFRPPAGVLTPPLVAAAQEMNIPLVLWNHRFFDTTFLWTEDMALKSARSLNSGDIILLHDCQKPAHQELFLKTLCKYLQAIASQGYVCRSLNDNLLLEETRAVATSQI